MSRRNACLMIMAVWAAIYLPALGTLEIKGEEGRRILPAVAMLESGNYIVPQVGGEAYLRKPPLINWMVAASFKLFGIRNEWTARVPSVLSVLAVGLAFVLIARSSLGSSGSIMAGLIWLSCFGTIEKGRLIEIEGIYVSLFGLALICWLSWWRQRRSMWLTWTVPLIFLGFGLLAKGPLLLLFFYAIVLAVLFQTGELSRLWHGAHFLGIALMLAVFAAWAIPYLQMMDSAQVTETWSRQILGRLGGTRFKVSQWILNIPRNGVYFLPWILLLPFIGGKSGPERGATLEKGLLWGIAIPFLFINLLPSSLPRYTLPLLVPAIWWLALKLDSEETILRGWLREKLASPVDRFRFVRNVSVVIALLVCVAAVVFVPIRQSRQKIRPIAVQIEAAVPPGERLYAVRVGFHPFLFYVRRPVTYVGQIEDLPKETRYFLVLPENAEKAAEGGRWAPLIARPALRITDNRNRSAILFAVGP